MSRNVRDGSMFDVHFLSTSEQIYTEFTRAFKVQVLTSRHLTMDLSSLQLYRRLVLTNAVIKKMSRNVKDAWNKV